jgi:hypothetical protein
MKKIISLALVFILFYCETTQEKAGDGFIYVKNITGINLDDAELNAKREIVAKGLGELVEGRTDVNQGQLMESVTNTSVEGFLKDYQQIGEPRKKGALVEIDAKGRVDRCTAHSIIEKLLNTMKNPNFLMIVDEEIDKKKSPPTAIVTENAIVKNFAEFQFLDKEQFRRILAKEGGKTIGVYGDTSAEAKATEVAAQMGAEILFIGQTIVKNAGPIMDSGMMSMQATVRFKIVDVGSAKLIAADNAGGAAPHVDTERGAQEAIDKALVTSKPKILDQIRTKWKRGMMIRLVIDGMNYDDFIDKDISGTIRNIKGVNAISQKGSSNSNNSIVLEVQADFNGITLYERMRQKREILGISFEQKEVKPGVVHIKVTK